ncbi:MAG: methyltransferase domain-containing protein [Cyanobacteria bacterium]|nr:methyltransferase domain-containing protein [Cyanobacteriota bacterium]
MGNNPDVVLEKVRQQFDAAPYPNIAPTASINYTADFLFVHNLQTPYYLRHQRVLDTAATTMLDAGCGSGCNALALAIANPGAKIVGVDLSVKSVELATQRLHHHGFTNCEFHAIALEELPSLGMTFDYINCDEVLSLLPDLTTGLRALQAVLKPKGIIRANVHSAPQRFNYYAAQEMCAMMGLLDGTPEEFEIGLVRETMEALRDDVVLKQATWSNLSEIDEVVLMNHLLQGDRGYTVPELFAALRAANLEFISMVDWRQWELLSLFNNPGDLPTFWAMSLPELSVEEQLTLYELMQPKNRLLDFWCGHPLLDPVPAPVVTWSLADWQGTIVHLHPQLRTDEVRQQLHRCIREHVGFCVSQHLSHPALTDVTLESTVAALLVPLWDAPQPISALVEHWLRLKPLDPVTLIPVSPAQAEMDVIQVLTRLESYLYVLVDRPLSAQYSAASSAS